MTPSLAKSRAPKSPICFRWPNHSTIPRRTTMAASPPAILDELFEEILLRLPPDDPACLLRAFLVCKAWGCLVSRPHFRRRLHELHRAPPVLGLLHDLEGERVPRFIPTTASSFSLAAPDGRFWRTLDCRHGRALFLSISQSPETQELLVWEPITGAQQRISVPAALESNSPMAAVFCAADGCDHRDCLGGPFRVLFILSVVVGQVTDDDSYLTSACAYSSETGTWGEPTSLPRRSPMPMCFTFYSSVLVRNSLLYFMSDDEFILEYDLARHRLAVFNPPNHELVCGQYTIMLAEDGGLGVCQRIDQQLKLWSREVSDSADARWVLRRVVYLENLLPVGALVDAETRVQVLGFAEGANAIFLTTVDGVFMIELQSERARRVCDDHLFCYLIPVVSFYTPVPRGEHRDPSLKHTEDAGGEEQGGEEKTVYQVQQLINKMSQMLPGGTLSAPSNAPTTP
ncbi:hypothetical protein ACQJBY_061455 [Aegilops geniculata]